MLVSLLLLLATCSAWSAQWVLIRDTNGTTTEAQTSSASIRLTAGGKPRDIRLDQVLSIHNGAPASDSEALRITAGIAAIQGDDRKARDQAVEELTAIGLPVITPLLKTYKDTDQHEPRPLYRLFERIIPSRADGFDRTLSLIRFRSGEYLRGQIASTSVELSSGDHRSMPWSTIRTLAVRQNAIHRVLPVHSLRHSNQIEFLDTAVVLTTSSKLDATTEGFVRLSWETDSWASDADGLQKPGSPSYKSNLFEGQPFGALIGRIGASGEVFFIGKKLTKAGLPAGRLQVAVNDNKHWQNNLGSFTATMTVTNAYDLGEAQ